MMNLPTAKPAPPVTAQLEWDCTGTVWIASVARYTNKLRKNIRHYASVRPTANANGLIVAHRPGANAFNTARWVVTMGDFDTVREFVTLDEAKRHVEAMFALDDHH
jgi:hypothetical protein